MNYEKKRKRQNGRQARKPQDSYSIYIDEACKIHAKLIKSLDKSRDPWAKLHAQIDKDIAEGRLPSVNFEICGFHG